MRFQMESCNGCQTCELACSFHHKGEFTPAVSSVKIADSPSVEGYGLELFEEDSGQRRACDGCKELDVPLCVAFCWESEDLKKVIDDFLGSRH